MNENQIRDMIKKYGMFLRSDGNIGLRSKPDNLEELKKLKPQLIEELKKIEEEKRIQVDPRVGQLSLDYYYGDWYRANSIFKTKEYGGNQPDWGNNENIFSRIELNKATASYWFKDKNIGFVDDQKIVKKLEELFDCDINTTKENIQKRFPDLTIIMKSYDDMRGKGEYVSEIIFPDFKTFEKYVQQAYQTTIEATKEYKAKVDAIYKKAKETGKKQVIAEYPVDCDDPNEECNVDIIYEYAMPTGEKKIDRVHTY